MWLRFIIKCVGGWKLISKISFQDKDKCAYMSKSVIRFLRKEKGKVK